MKHIVFLLLLCFIGGVSFYAHAQTPGTGNITGFLFVPGHTYYRNAGVPDDFDLTAGAVIALTTAADTFYTIATKRGGFQFENIPLGKGTITVTHLSYETISKDVEIERNTRVSITMVEKAVTLNAVTVMGEVPLITMYGDTMKINAAAVALMEGDVALEILKQAPGVEITDGGIKVLGKNVERTYVNKHMIFGRNEMTALVNIPASEVVSINTYEEYKELDSLSRYSKEKVRVLDIKTKNPILSATSGHAIASMGHDVDPAGRTRYGIGANGNFFSEFLLLSVNAFTNNVNRQSNLKSDIISLNERPQNYEKTDYAEATIEKIWGKDPLQGDQVHLFGSYLFKRNYSSSENKLHNIYLPLPSAPYTSREYTDSSGNSRTTFLHDFTLFVDFSKQKVGHFKSSTLFKLNDAESGLSRRNESMLDGNSLGGHSNHKEQQHGYDFTQSLNIGKRFGQVSINIGATYGRSDNDGSAYRVDSIASTSLRTIIESGPIGLSQNAELGGGIFLSSDIIPYINVGYKFNYENSRRKRSAAEELNMFRREDTLNTYNYTHNYRTHRVEAITEYNPKNGRSNFSLRYQSSEANRDERFPYEQNFRRWQNALLPYFHFENGWDKLRVFLTYQTSVVLPSMEQWRSQLDNRNPYLLIAGNPNLRQSYTHDLFIANIFSLRNNSDGNIYVRVQAILTERMIADKTTYFITDTLLPAWNTMAPAQSTLIEYENLNGSFMGRLAVHYNWAPKAIRSRLAVAISLKYDRMPSYVQGLLNKTEIYTPSLSFDLKSNFSQVFRIKAGISGRYIYSKNTIGQDNRLLNLTGMVSSEWRIFKGLFLNTIYNTYYYKSFAGMSVNNTHILNASAGYKLLKGNLELSLAAYDILNRDTGFSTVMTNDYISNRWTQSFGRYFTFNIVYNFFKSKSGITRPEGISIRDGSTKFE
jgi:hypothetical protein